MILAAIAGEAALSEEDRHYLPCAQRFELISMECLQRPDNSDPLVAFRVR